MTVKRSPGSLAALRDAGAAVERAACRAESPAGRVAGNRRDRASSDRRSMPELRASAAERGIPGRHSMRKEELIAALGEG